jgi:hypothetical protein
MTDQSLLESAEHIHGSLEDAAKVYGVKASTWDAWKKGEQPLPLYIRRALKRTLAREG